MENSNTSLFTVDQDLRIDKLLTEHFKEYSRSYFHFLIEQGAVLCKGKTVKKREKLPIGSQVTINFIHTEPLSVNPENIPLDILFEDKHIIAINKPAGMVVHPAPGHPNKTFVNALLYHCQLEPSLKEDPIRPGIVHRLDKETSGILLAAKTRKAHQALIEIFANRKIQKTYLCIALGKLADQTITSFIKRHPKHRQKMTSSPTEGKEAKTSFTLLDFHTPFSLIECELHTGRTHQIRVHLSSIGLPIVGDSLYGSATINKSYSVDRQLLHAYKVNFDHPITHEPITLTAPLPQNLKNWAKKQGLQHPCL